ncbi:phenylacetate--CoA ligase family protein [Actinocrispum wychmicini]|uniref:Phenylacetate-coenzyme A ligase PaaK-like adenylate-forming protein n=1 Tax=Actinocrispum wychmicini TaxID=1213861 RepID=A0A4R2JRP6_9PSEU|nr:AMP-binding protein [Actinocrispum wychmicini]TCO62214.1 phenylacetate-coenzyme A ligase PaaK-like adenylate-forming protein [Actinocrispum wychmicini]
MFETGIRQLRMAMGMVRGRRLDTRNITRLVDDALATLREFGEPGADARDLIDGPLTDPAARLDFATEGVRRTATRLASQSPFYARRFASAGVPPAKLDVAGLAAVPVTVKRDLVERPDDFQCADTSRYLATRTTGTSGRPAEIWMSRYEMDLWPAIGSLAAVLRDDLRPSDVMQVNISSRATAAVHLDVACCRLVGAACRVLGTVPPDDALDSLAEQGATLLATTPSYLGELEAAARRRGMGPDDFQLRRVDVGGEVLSTSLVAAARETFGVPGVNDLFAMTEVVPVTGRMCGHGHLHHDINMGLVEYLDLESGEPAEPGALATVVVTPFFPYRDCMPVFRYDTRDVVQCLPDEPLTCEVAGLPGTGPIVGKADQLVRLGPGDIVTPRQLIEAIEALPTRPWPARFRSTVDNGRLRLTVPASVVDGLSEGAATGHFADRGLDVDLDLVPDDEAPALRHLRSDLHETTFTVRPTLIGA